MVDGFHRNEVQEIRRKPLLLVTVEPHMTYEEVIRRRLEYARAHPEVEFARQVEWMQSVWERTPWHNEIPNVLTAFRAHQDDYAYGGTDDIEQIDGLSDRKYQDICAWVAQQSKAWGYTPSQIRENLAKAESFDPNLMRLVYQRPGKVPPGRIGLNHVEVIKETYGGEFDLQTAIVTVVVREQLSPQQTTLLIRKLEDDSPRTAADIERLAARVDILDLKAKSHRTLRSVGKTSVRGVEQLTGLSHSEALSQFRKMLPDIQSAALDRGQWTRGDADAALEISMTLAETLAQLSINLQANGQQT